MLGGGVLGRRIACVWVAGCHNVIIRDPSEEQRHAAILYIDNQAAEYARKAEGLSYSKLGQYSATDDLKAAVKDAWRKIDGFFKIAIEEGCFDVDLVAFQVKVIDQGEKNPDGVVVSNHSKELIAVDAFNLRVFLRDPLSS